MKVEVLASGSSANSYAVHSGGKVLLLDCGLCRSYQLARLNYRLPDAVLVTHEHIDHAKSVRFFLERGVEVYMTRGTAEALKLSRHNLNLIGVGWAFGAAGFFVRTRPSVHDAAEPVNFIIEDEQDRMLYVTDTGEVPKVRGKFTKIFIEANYARRNLLNSGIDENQKQRILTNHLSVEKAIEFLKENPAEEVHLIHISQRHGNGEEFARLVREATGLEKVFSEE